MDDEKTVRFPQLGISTSYSKVMKKVFLQSKIRWGVRGRGADRLLFVDGV